MSKAEKILTIAVNLTLPELLVLDAALRFTELDHVQRQGHRFTEAEFEAARQKALVAICGGARELTKTLKMFGE